MRRQRHHEDLGFYVTFHIQYKTNRRRRDLLYACLEQRHEEMGRSALWRPGLELHTVAEAADVSDVCEGIEAHTY